MIYYDIQHHGETTRHLRWLVAHLAPHACKVSVALDAPPLAVEALGRALAPLGSDRVECRSSLPVVWAGPSVVSQMREALRHACETDGWEWFINLSGACAPLAPPLCVGPAIRRRSEETGKLSFCSSFVPRIPEFWLAYTSPGDGLESRVTRARVVMDGAASEAHREGTFNPVRNVMQRRAVYCSERVDATSRVLYVRGLYAAELHDRQAFWRTHPYTIGRQWVVLHRQAVEWLCEAPVVADLWNFLGQSFLPDETYFQTTLAAAPPRVRTKTAFRWNFRHRRGAPGPLLREELEQSAQAGCLFARKVADDDDAMRELIERHVWPLALAKLQ